VSEVEANTAQIASLLDDRMQSEQDLQFMLDNSLDVILVADSIGLLMSWNKRAELKFGYTSEQAIGKLHMDDLFTDNFWEKELREDRESCARMEHVEGHSFDMGVRVKSVSHRKSEYRIYVLRELAQEPKQSESMTNATLA